jgi:hypothetical protein
MHPEFQFDQPVNEQAIHKQFQSRTDVDSLVVFMILSCRSTAYGKNQEKKSQATKSGSSSFIKSGSF